MQNSPESHHKPRKSSSFFSWPAVMLAGLVACLGTGLWIFHRIEQAPQRMWQGASDDLQRRAAWVVAAMREVVNVHPRVEIRNFVFCEQTTEALELAVAKRRVKAEREMQHSWAGSSKRIRLRGEFEGRAGFDLARPVTATVTENQVDIVLPAAKLLGIETVKIEVEELSNGMWNRISAGDLEREIANLKEIAWKELESQGLPVEAEKSIEKRLSEKLGAGISVTFSDGLPPKS